jgi:GrpB-like predicted nucleotidyltransferase (UPF0157 family)/predicted N-acetyltransferase YhbS
MQNIRIRHVNADDVPELLKLIHAAFEQYRGRLDPPSGAHDETAASLRGYLMQERGLLATIDDEPVGCLFYVPQDDVLYVHRLAVSPTHRGLGLGRALMAAAEQEAHNLGLSRMRVGVRTVLVGNKLFYESLGYRVVSAESHPGYSVATSFTMEKSLAPEEEAPSLDMRHIRVVAYNPAWTLMFAEEAEKLRDALGDELVDIHHIGSTAVVGIHAKPVIDILPVVRDINQVDRRNPWMVSLGYAPRGENHIPGRRYFCKESDGERTHHVHVFQAGHPEIDRHVDFCAYLNAHPADAQRYVELKRALAAAFPHDIMGYNDGKTALIRELDAKAAAWKSAQAQR